MGGVGDPRPPHTFSKPRLPGRSLAPSASGEGECPREQKPRHPAFASPGRGGLSLISLCATEARARLTALLLLFSPRRGWGSVGPLPTPPITSETC